MRQRVAVAVAAGMAHEQIAIALGIARNTLEKHFEVELSRGAYQRRMEVVFAQFRAAKKGNVSAQKAFLANEPHMATPPIPAAGAEDAPKAAKRGKKEQAQVDAAGAARGTSWEELLPKPGQPIQ